MREYHKWLLSATSKCAVPRLTNFNTIPPGRKYVFDDRECAKLIACLRAAIVYVNLKHDKTRHTGASVSEQRVCACDRLSDKVRS